MAQNTFIYQVTSALPNADDTEALFALGPVSTADTTEKSEAYRAIGDCVKC